MLVIMFITKMNVASRIYLQTLLMCYCIQPTSRWLVLGGLQGGRGGRGGREGFYLWLMNTLFIMCVEIKKKAEGDREITYSSTCHWLSISC